MCVRPAREPVGTAWGRGFRASWQRPARSWRNLCPTSPPPCGQTETHQGASTEGGASGVSDVHIQSWPRLPVCAWTGNPESSEHAHLCRGAVRGDSSETWKAGQDKQLVVAGSRLTAEGSRNTSRAPRPSPASERSLGRVGCRVAGAVPPVRRLGQASLALGRLVLLFPRAAQHRGGPAPGEEVE